MDLELKGRVALITGASKGIGKAIALALAREGALPCLLSRSAANLEAAAGEIRERTGVTPVAIEGDVENPALASRLVAELVQAHGRLDILVNNAEGPPMGSFLELDDARWEEAIARSLMGPVRFSRACAPAMKQQGWGRIINITTVLAKEPAPAMILSSTLRAGVSAFAKAISTELAPHGITVNTVCPSAVLTERMENLTQAAAQREGKSPAEILARAMKSIPAGRFSTPAEIADLVAFLCSERGAYITGLSVSVDGGLTKGVY